MFQSLILIFVCFNAHLVISFFSSHKSISISSTIRNNSPNSYANLLQEVRQKKQAQESSTQPSATFIPLSQLASTSTSTSNSSTKQPWQMAPEPKNARDKASFKNKVPFSEEIYDTLKTSIELLSERIKSNKPLTVVEATWFKSAIDVIIEDANLYGPPERPKQIPNPDQGTEGEGV